MKIPRCPNGLKPRGRKFWKKVNESFEIEEPHDIELLILACQCIDRISEARKEVKTSGPFYVDRWGQPRPHPGIKVIQDQTNCFARLCRELQLDIEPASENRIKGRY